MTSKQKTVRVDKFLGLQLKKDPYELKKGELLKAENIDITDEDKVRRRKGFSFEREVANRKIWGGSSLLLSVEGTDLVSLAPDLTPTTIRSDLNAVVLPDFCEAGAEVYYNDGTVNGKFAAGVHTDWAVEQPGGFPTFTAGSGILYEGCYHFVMTYEHADGRESGCGASVKINLTDGQGVVLTSIPQPASANISYIRLYLSEANSDTLRLYSRVTVGTTSATLSSRRRGDELTTQFMYGPPAGAYIGFCASRVLIAVGPVLFFSMPFSYHLFKLATDHLTVSGDINMIATTPNGAYIGADKTYYVSFAAEQPTLAEVFKAKSVMGTVSYIDAKDIGSGEGEGILPVWVSEQGVAYGSATGAVSLFNEEAISIGQPSRGATLLRDDRGITQVISTLRGADNQNVYVGDTVEATVRRRGVLEEFNIVTHTGEPMLTHTGEPMVYAE